MISDDELYRLAVFLGSAAMILIVVYHFFDVNARTDETVKEKTAVKAAQTTPTSTKSR
ncbi:Oligosaccaryltransferase-domain-containing protein [Bombardia bombarda]|uniref:Dolichyl-diphosphooligosaccharide--protein glycosyltransferase subunit 4 n=1 Tax=Bombardia bombarda TaxID=252184 RepID=A0AA39XJM8_9PEZI|nr:Oligosaccaryltransferase-domain-containing protein [Bombardia bombarda]